MLLRPFVKISLGTLAVGFLAMSLGCVSKPTKAAIKLPPPAISRPGPVTITPPAEKLPPVLLGIDVLEADKFAAIAGKVKFTQRKRRRFDGKLKLATFANVFPATAGKTVVKKPAAKKTVKKAAKKE